MVQYTLKRARMRMKFSSTLHFIECWCPLRRCCCCCCCGMWWYDVRCSSARPVTIQFRELECGEATNLAYAAKAKASQSACARAHAQQRDNCNARARAHCWPRAPRGGGDGGAVRSSCGCVVYLWQDEHDCAHELHAALSTQQKRYRQTHTHTETKKKTRYCECVYFMWHETCV